APARQYKGDPPAAPTVPAAPAPTAPQVAAAPAPAAREDSRNRTAQAKSPVRAIRVEVAAFLPSFPWPPPKPSARAELPSSMFVLSSKPAPTLAAVGARLVGALEDARYFEYSFYQAPGGFALVARLERMSNDGTPLPEQFRFLEPASDEPFVLSAYVKQLFFAPEGFYRQIVFVVADVPFTATGAMLDTRGAQRLLGGGA